jgi:YD repeat-containing protein
MLLADGSYNPRLGSSSRLTLSSGTYGLTYKDGTALSFDANGNVSAWTSPVGTAVSFAYDNSTPPLLTSVANNAGRNLTLSYNTSQQLTSVTDNSTPARSVAYAYDGAGNLVSFTDPLGNTMTFAYTPTGGSTPANLVAQIFYPSSGAAFVTNTYDTLGRVAAQANANGATWTYFFAGYRSEEDNPYGTRHVLFYNPRGKLTFDVQDLAGLDLISGFSYDGFDRLVASKLPEGGSTTYTYDTTVNPWANNVASVTRNPKPGSLLGPSTTTYAYEPLFNKPVRITGPPTPATSPPTGMVTTVSYDAGGNPATVTVDVGLTTPPPSHLNAVTRYAYNGLGQVASPTPTAWWCATSTTASATSPTVSQTPTALRAPRAILTTAAATCFRSPTPGATSPRTPTTTPAASSPAPRRRPPPPPPASSPPTATTPTAAPCRSASRAVAACCARPARRGRQPARRSPPPMPTATSRATPTTS